MNELHTNEEMCVEKGMDGWIRCLPTPYPSIEELSVCVRHCARYPAYVISASLPAIRIVGIVILILKMKKPKFRKKKN